MTRAHEPTVKSRAEVTSLTSFGITQEDICKYLGISIKTLEKHYRYEIDTAVTRANGQVANALYTKAVKGNDTTAMIFWLKTRAQWREVNRTEITGKDGKPLEIDTKYQDIDLLMKERFKLVLNKDVKHVDRDESK